MGVSIVPAALGGLLLSNNLFLFRCLFVTLVINYSEGLAGQVFAALSTLSFTLQYCFSSGLLCLTFCGDTMKRTEKYSA